MLKKRLFISYTVLISLFMIVVLTAVNRAVSGTIDTQMESVTREAVEVESAISTACSAICFPRR